MYVAGANISYGLNVYIIYDMKLVTKCYIIHRTPLVCGINNLYLVDLLQLSVVSYGIHETEPWESPSIFS